jgi:hypothetical protein
MTIFQSRRISQKSGKNKDSSKEEKREGESEVIA